MSKTEYGFKLAVSKIRHPADNNTLDFLHRHFTEEAKRIGGTGYEVVEITEDPHNVNAIIRVIFDD